MTPGTDRVAATWELRATAPELRAGYLASGLWTDDTLAGFIDSKVAAQPTLGFRVWSERHPAVTDVATVWERARRFASGLAARGVGAGDVVAFQFPNCTEAAIAFWGATVAGAVVVPVVHFYGPKELEYILRESRARVLVTADHFGHLDYVAGIGNLRPHLPDLETVVVWRTDRHDGAGDGSALPPDVVAFDDIAATDPVPAPVALDPDTPAVVAYTSGTTADPKGVIHTHRSLIAEVRQLAAMQSPEDLPMLIGAPVAHAIGMLGGLLVPVERGRDIHITDAWKPSAVLDAMLEAKISAGSGATVFLTSLLDHPDFTPAHAALMRWVGLGGAPVPTAVVERAEALGISVTRSYGSTEHPSTTGSDPSAPVERRMRTDGRPLGGVELRIIDEDGRDLEPGEPGEIVSRGPDLCAGYANSALTAGAFDDEGWYSSGDIGVLDEDGFLSITDRLKDIIIRGGVNVSAAEVEELLVRMDGVAEVAVVAAPDDRLGEHGCAYVRLRPEGSAPDLAGVREHLEAAGLARPKWPEELHVVEEFPRTPSGKIKKFVLRAERRAEADRAQESPVQEGRVQEGKSR
jgi:acyl-CoA synthetase (AMP-forming)/AMP-acid ligase II